MQFLSDNPAYMRWKEGFMLSSNTILYPLQEVSKGEVSHPQFKAGRVNLIIKIKS